jgi:circadian clock protein KaiC
MATRVGLQNLPTAIPGLDAVLGGGFPEYSFNIVAGEPGSGKTTLLHQFLFNNASPERTALYFTALGEPPLKMLRYQQQMRFFDPAKIGKCIRFIDLAAQVRDGDLANLLATIKDEVTAASPAIVVIDSFRSVIQSQRGGESQRETASFLQQLALYLASWQITSFLLGEYGEDDVHADPIFTVCDGLLWLYQSRERNSVVRKLQAKKIRGQASMPGVHTFRISDAGLRVFPRTQRRPEQDPRVRSNLRISTGVPALDTMMGGGIPIGDSLLVAGPTGVGKTLVSSQFIAEGLAHGEPGVIALFEEHPDDYIQRAHELGMDLRAAIERGALKLVYLRPLDLSVDETLQEIREAVDEIGAKRFVMDSLSGFELALAPDFREDFREALYRMVGALTGIGVTTLLTVEVTEVFNELSFSPHAVSFLTENILLLRYVEMRGELKKVLAVVKMRRSAHAHDLRAFDITPTGIVVSEALRDFQNILSGAPKLREGAPRATHAGLTEQESRVLEEVTRLQTASVEAIVKGTGFTESSVAAALRRLVLLDYLADATAPGLPLYRVLARPV